MRLGRAEPILGFKAETPYRTLAPPALTVAYDATGAGFSQTAEVATPSISWPHFITGNAIVVGVACNTANTGFASWATTITVGSATVNFLRGENADNLASQGDFVILYGLLWPPRGLQTVTASLSNGSVTAALVGCSVSYFGVAAFGAVVTNFGQSATVSTGAVPSAVGNMVVAASGIDAAQAFTSPSGGAVRYNQPVPGVASVNPLLMQDAAGAASVTLTSAVVGAVSSDWSTVAVNLIPMSASNSIDVSMTNSSTMR